MISALRRWPASNPRGCSIFRAAGSIVGAQNTNISARTSLSQPFGTTGGRGAGGGAAFELLDEDIEERFVKGSGPGGQKINKVRNCVQLTHVPSGVSVSCQDSRELHANRHIARKRLKEKVEFQLKGDDSKVGRRISKIRNRKARSQRKARLKHQGGAAAAAAATATAAAATADGQQATAIHGEERAAREAVDSCDDVGGWEREAGEDSGQDGEGNESGRR